MSSTFAIDLAKTSRTANIGIVLLCGLFGVAGYFVSFYFHFLTVAFFLLVLLNLYWRHVQRSHTLLANFGFLAQFRYLVESVGPEFRLLPKEKITTEIAELRGVPMGQDVLSPAHHVECVDAASTVEFIGRIQRVSNLPTGIKFCLGRPDELRALVEEMNRQDTVPDFITVDGGEGGTGAAPKSFMDDLGLPLFEALPLVHQILRDEGVRDRLVIFASGKLISPGKQLKALSFGADVAYSARGFLLALGSVITVSVMCGAIIAHVTQLGLVVNNDGGRLVGILAVVLLCAGFVLVSRRKEIPFVGETF